ncbi:MAG: HD domain-containing protein [Chloroflexi bacterium]|jgi:metal-dependent HD superfamily phosphatase/phosphodiesterase|nr:HD domain-containing protein [Chloroflexota bacterium]
MPINLPTRHNENLAKVLEIVNADRELHQLWKCANVTAVDRSGITDHGEVHIRIVANIALKMLRLLDEGQVPMSVVQNYGLTVKEAEIIVFLAACFHDLGISIHRNHHENHSLFLADRKAREILADIYDVEERTILVSEVLHAVAAHRADETCLTTEASILKVADALDMTKGRSRIPFESGSVNIHSVSAAAIDQVILERGVTKPVHIEVVMNNSAGIFQLDELLKRKIRMSTLVPHIELVAKVEGEIEKRLIEIYSL